MIEKEVILMAVKDIKKNAAHYPAKHNKTAWCNLSFISIEKRVSFGFGKGVVLDA